MMTRVDGSLPQQDLSQINLEEVKRAWEEEKLSLDVVPVSGRNPLETEYIGSCKNCKGKRAYRKRRIQTYHSFFTAEEVVVYCTDCKSQDQHYAVVYNEIQNTCYRRAL